MAELVKLFALKSTHPLSAASREGMCPGDAMTRLALSLRPA